MKILRPDLVLPIGKLAIEQFLEFEKLTDVIGRSFSVTKYGHTFDVIPLPHPSGASPWHRVEPGKTLLERALRLIVSHPSWPQGGGSSRGEEALRTKLKRITPPPVRSNKGRD
jgi:uracil-DNA glycosylase